MPPLTEEGERCAPRATWPCIDEPPKSAGRSRSASLPSAVKGRAWRHRLLRAPGMSNLVAPRPSLKLSGMLDEPLGSPLPSTPFSLVTIPLTVNNQLLDEPDALFLSTNKCTTPGLRLQHLRQFPLMGIKCLPQLLQGFSGCKLSQLL